MQLIADAYHNPPFTRAVPAAPPGTSVSFRGGHARIFDERTLLWCLTKPEISLRLEPSYLGHLGRWVEELRQMVKEPQAQIVDPSGSIIGPAEYSVPGWMAPEVRARFHEAALAEEDEQLGRAPAPPATGAIVWGSASSA